MVKIFIEKEDKNTEVKASTVKEALTILNINPETVLAVKNDELLNLNDSLQEQDKIKLLSVISGG